MAAAHIESHRTLRENRGHRRGAEDTEGGQRATKKPPVQAVQNDEIFKNDNFFDFCASLMNSVFFVRLERLEHFERFEPI
jgi:hypothetical protein